MRIVSLFTCCLFVAEARRLGGGDEAFEWSGVFPITGANTPHQWIMQKVNCKYADPSMKVVFIPTPTPDEATRASLETQGESLIEGSCSTKTNGQTISIADIGTGACFDLHVDNSLAEVTFNIETTDLSGLAIFAQHVPTEFEETKHYLKDNSGTDVEPASQEPDGGHHHHGPQCACAAKDASPAWSINCGSQTSSLAAIDYLANVDNLCNTTCNSDECKRQYYIMQAHHDHCSHEDMPASLEQAIHDYEGFYEDCTIKRQYDDHLGACPTIDCNSIGTELATVETDLSGNLCNSNCSTTVCTNLIQKLLMAHDTCSEDTLTTEQEKALHDYEDSCHEQLCNSVSGTFDAMTHEAPGVPLVCPHASSASRAAAGSAALVASLLMGGAMLP